MVIGPLKNKAQLNAHIKKQARLIETAMIYRLEFLVQKLINHAKTSAGYNDITSNLKSSIGGVLLKDRIPVTYSGFTNEGNADVGENKGIEFMSKVTSIMPSGYVIVLVAGMEYASYVENYYGKNVLKKTELLMNDEFPKLIAKLKLL